MMGQTDLDGALRRDVVSEVAGVEVALEPTQRQDELRVFDLLLDLFHFHWTVAFETTLRALSLPSHIVDQVISEMRCLPTGGAGQEYNTVHVHEALKPARLASSLA